MGQPAEQLCSVSIDERRHDTRKIATEQISVTNLHQWLTDSGKDTVDCTGKNVNHVPIGHDELCEAIAEADNYEVVTALLLDNLNDKSELGHIFYRKFIVPYFRAWEHSEAEQGTVVIFINKVAISPAPAPHKS